MLLKQYYLLLFTLLPSFNAISQVKDDSPKVQIGDDVVAVSSSEINPCIGDYLILTNNYENLILLDIKTGKQISNSPDPIASFNPRPRFSDKKLYILEKKDTLIQNQRTSNVIKIYNPVFKEEERELFPKERYFFNFYLFDNTLITETSSFLTAFDKRSLNQIWEIRKSPDSYQTSLSHIDNDLYYVFNNTFESYNFETGVLNFKFQEKYRIIQPTIELKKYKNLLLFTYEIELPDESKLKKIVALDCSTGKSVWEINEKINRLSETVFLENHVVLEVNKKVVFIDALSGKETSAIDMGLKEGDNTNLAVDNRILYIRNSKGMLMAIDTKTFQKKWEFKITSNFMSNPKVYNGIVVIMDYGSTYALNAETGKIKWALNEAIETYGVEPIIEDDQLLIREIVKTISLNLETGSRKWVYDNKKYYKAKYSKGFVYIDNDNELYAINATSGQKVWGYMKDTKGRSVELNIVDCSMELVK